MKGDKQPVTHSTISLRKQAEQKLEVHGAPEEITHSDTLKLVHELQVHQIELQMQNEELIIANTKIDLALARYTELYDFSPVSYLTVDQMGSISHLNLAAAQLLCSERRHLIGKRFGSYVNSKDLVKFNTAIFKLFENQSNKAVCDLSLKLEGNTLRHVYLEAKLDEKRANCLVTLVDITERKQAEEKLMLAANVFTYAHEGIMITDAMTVIVEVNETFSHISGYSRGEVIGKKADILHSGNESLEFYRSMWNEIKTSGYWLGEIKNQRKNGEQYVANLSVSAVFAEDGSVKQYVVMQTDVTQLKEHQRELVQVAHFDPLTNLPNRSLLLQLLDLAMTQCERNQQSLAFVLLDFDDFAAVNHKYGDVVGNELLTALSVRIRNLIREGDTLARVGGDEFALILPELVDSNEYEAQLQRLLTVISSPLKVGDVELRMTASLGVSIYPLDSVEADMLMRHAEQAMFTAKELGKNCYHLFDTEQNTALQNYHEDIAAIDNAITCSEFVLFYQPKVNMQLGEVVGVEALIRWQHPQRGLLQPLEFLPLIEGHSIIIKMGEWVLNTALLQISHWQKMGLNLSISVNIDALQIQQDDFVIKLTEILACHPEVNPSLLELEILETSALNNVLQISSIMQDTINLGVEFALDDFGTGYSSLTYLKHLPANLIKIDQTFIRDMLIDPEDRAIVKGVIGLSKAFKRKVIAEGVETIEHGSALLKLGCELAQGYGIARPMPGSDIPEWVSHWKPDPVWTAQH